MPSNRTHSPQFIAYDAVMPRLADQPEALLSGASIIGRVEMGARAVIGQNAVIRADGHFVRIGDDLALGRNATIHIAHELYPTIIGHRVKVGQNAVVHACTVGDDCVIENGAVILDGAVVESNTLIEAGSVVFPRKNLAGDFVYEGSPVRPVRPLDFAERDQRGLRIQNEAGKEIDDPNDRPAGHSNPTFDQNFAAPDATLHGSVRLQPHASIFFACRLLAGNQSITIGERTNVQDNTRILCRLHDVVIGSDTTIGHNVTIVDSIIGSNSLIGIGSVLSAGTRVDNEVLLAAGSTTIEGQHIETGWVWGGRPAKPIAKLDDAKRAMFREIVRHYMMYADTYRASLASA